jgi:hypothetical protein
MLALLLILAYQTQEYTLEVVAVEDLVQMEEMLLVEQVAVEQVVDLNVQRLEQELQTRVVEQVVEV